MRRTKTATDPELIASVAAGDRAALDALHARYYPRLYKLAYVRLGHADDAHDVASQVFLRAIQHIGRLHPLRTTTLYPWLHAVASNLITDLLRRRRIRSHVSLDDRTRTELARYLERVPNGQPLPDAVLERKELQAIVREAIAALPESQADAVLARFVGELSIREVAEQMNRSEGAVKSLLHRAIASLRKALQQQLRSAGHAVAVRGEQDVSGSTVQIHR
jgi:RNA polymerase sigma-70 factor (ECF subfamily)